MTDLNTKRDRHRGSYLPTECDHQADSPEPQLSTGSYSSNDEPRDAPSGDPSNEEQADDLANSQQDDIIMSHPSYEQVMLDVNRCAGRLERMRQVYFHRTDYDSEPPEDLTPDFEFEEESSDSRSCSPTTDRRPHSEELDQVKSKLRREDLKNQRELKLKLAKLIVKLLIKKPNLHYYQGFHDVCLTYMTLLGADEAYQKLDSMIDSHFQIFMQPTMNETQEFLDLIPVIIGLRDSKAQEFLAKSEVGTIFALSWVITWFSHVISNERDVERLFKFLENLDPHMVLYVCASMVLYKRDELLKLELEMSTVHHFLCQVPRKENLPLSELLLEAELAYAKWPPDYVRKKLEESRRVTGPPMHNLGLLRNMALGVVPTISRFVPVSTRTALVVLVLASALALQYDRWTRRD